MYIHPPPTFALQDMLTGITPDLLSHAVPIDEKGRYLHWDDLRHRPLPSQWKNLTEYWRHLKFHRLSASRHLPFKDVQHRHFFYCHAALERSISMLDRIAAGNIDSPAAGASRQQPIEHHLVSGLMDEAIHSSQLEGASTTYAQAKEMLRENRQPTDHSERMIFNNHLAMRKISDNFRMQDLSMDMLRELHSIVTDGTLENPKDGGRARDCDKDDEGFGVHYNDELIHRPPPWRELPARLQALCDFANAPHDSHPFVHPATRAMILHFMLAYDHPFIDGNGRTARALFYWAMARHGYWLAAYAPISAVIKRSDRDYVRAFLLSENDHSPLPNNNHVTDMTYFLVYHVRAALTAMERFMRHVKERERRLRAIEARLPADGAWNGRQIALIRHALRHSDSEYLPDRHAAFHRVSKPTAIADMNKLAAAKLLRKRKRGKRLVYFAAANLRARLNA